MLINILNNYNLSIDKIENSVDIKYTISKIANDLISGEMELSHELIKRMKDSYISWYKIPSEIYLKDVNKTYNFYKKIKEHDIDYEFLVEHLCQLMLESRNLSILKKLLIEEPSCVKLILSITSGEQFNDMDDELMSILSSQFIEQCQDNDNLYREVDQCSLINFIIQKKPNELPESIIKNRTFVDKHLESIQSDVLLERIKNVYRQYIPNNMRYTIVNIKLMQLLIDEIIEFMDYMDFSIINNKDEIIFSYQLSRWSTTITDIVKYNKNDEHFEFLWEMNEKSKSTIKKKIKLLNNLPDEIDGELFVKPMEFYFKTDASIPKKYIEMKNIIRDFNSQEDSVLSMLMNSKNEQKIKAKLIKDFSENNKYYKLHLDLISTYSSENEVNELLTRQNMSTELIKRIELLPVSDRNFGFELEFSSSLSKMKLGHVMKGHGFNINVSNSYHKSEGFNWDFKQDSSVVSVNGGFTVELASPILSGNDGIKEASKFLNCLFKESNVSVGEETCSGLHVHHEVKDLIQTEELIKYYGNELRKVQEAIYSLCADYRQDNSYCSRISDKSRFVFDERDGFNFTKMGTLEFRMRESLNNTQDIINWIKITQQVVENLIYVKNNDIVKYNESQSNMMDSVGDLLLMKNPTSEMIKQFVVAKKFSKMFLGNDNE